MKTIHFFIPVMLLCGVLSIQGCAEDEGEDTPPPPCIEGTWMNDVPCYSTVKYTFNSDGTGKVWEVTCPNQFVTACTNGAEWWKEKHFTYEVTTSGLTLSYTAFFSCDTLVNNNQFTITEAEFNCDEDIMTLGTEAGDTYIRQ